MSSWPGVDYAGWSATCDTLHAHTQVLGKLAVELAAPEPHFQHTALRVTARGWETYALPAPNGGGLITAALDLRSHEATVEHSDGGSARIPLTPDRAVADVTRDVLDAVADLGGAVAINPKPQEVAWDVPLDQDRDHATYDREQVAAYFAAARAAALVLSEFRAPFRGRSSPVNAWWGAFDLRRPPVLGQADRAAVRRLHHAQLGGRRAVRGRVVAGRSALRPSGVLRLPLPDARGVLRLRAQTAAGPLGQRSRRVRARLGGHTLAARPAWPGARVRALGVSTGVRAICEWDPSLAASAQGVPPPIR